MLNDDTVFLMNVIKDVYRRSQLKVEKKDLIYEICKNHTVAEKWSQYYHMVDWLVMESRH